MSRILLGVSGGIAAYKALELVRLATGAGHVVRVVQTPTSRRFVGSASFAALTGAPVLVDEFERDPARGAFPDQQPPAHEPIGHLALVENADLYAIAPASANTIARLAHGHADNLLTSAAIAATCPLLVAPAMNNHMYAHPAVQANLQTLRDRGATVLEPDTGRLASQGEHGVGRLPDPARLLAACEQLLGGAAPAECVLPDGAGDAAPAGYVLQDDADDRSRSAPAGAGQTGQAAGVWGGLRVLVTAGGTREPIDSVRFLGNSSSGRMGLALARAAAARGARVAVIAANVALERPAGVRWHAVRTAAELAEACEQEFPDCDVLLMAAAVADFRPVATAEGKLKKAGRERLSIELEPTADVLRGLSARRRPNQTLVGFAAEHGEGALEYGRAKLREKDLDAIVVNDISRPDIGFEVDRNEVTVLTCQERNGTAPAAVRAEHVAPASKAAVAEAILDAVGRLRT
jgi:phosphopantothenoylcysteine decarboxylase / phosphopantothenate---cysteine ligase